MSTSVEHYFLHSANSSRQLIGKCGFSLIELLVVISVVALLLALMLPALASSREAVRANQCRGNLRQLQIASIIYIDECLKRQIPATKTQDNPMWPSWSSFKTVMNKDKEKNILLLGSNPPGVCPSVHNRYSNNPDYGYIGGIGYVVNAWWTNALNEKAGSYNEPNINRTAKLITDIKKWDMIRRPSTYPWMMDSEISKDIFLAARYAPQYMGSFNWGIGANHDNEKTANIARADGSVAAYSMAMIHTQMPETTPASSDLRVGGKFDFLKNE